MDLSAVRKQITSHIESLQVEGGPYGCYRLRNGGQAGLYATCDAAIIRTIMGEDLRSSLMDQQRAEWIDHINSFAREDGVYEGGGLSDQHRNGAVIGALGPLGGKQKYPVSLYKQFDTPEKIAAWLEGLDWVNLWGASHLFWGGMFCYSMSRHCTDEWRRRAFDWLDANVDENTAWWRKGVPKPQERLSGENTPEIESLGGAAHIWPFYQHHNRPFPYPKPLIDSILAMHEEDGRWRLGLADYYLELDALYGLAYMQSLAPGYREDDIANAVARHGELVSEAYPGYLDRNPDLHDVLSMVGIFGLLNQMAPEVFTDSVTWTDIFSDIRLYQTGEVESE